jgi:hypothetical protein
MLWALGIFCGNLVYILLFWYVVLGKSGNPGVCVFKGQARVAAK